MSKIFRTILTTWIRNSTGKPPNVSVSEPGILRASLVAQMVKHLPTVQETCVRSLGREDPLEKELATHSNNFAWEIPWTEEPGGLQFMKPQRVRHD